MYSILTVLAATAPAPVELVTLDVLKAELAITGTAQDAQLEMQITHWSKIIAAFCRRSFGQQTVTQTFTIPRSARRERDRIMALALEQTPIVGDLAVEMNELAVDAADYDLDPQSGVLRHRHRPWHGRVAVTYSGGYSLPEGAEAPLARACIELIKEQRFAAKRDPALRGFQDGDQRVDYWVGPRGDANDALPSFVLDMISPYMAPLC